MRFSADQMHYAYCARKPQAYTELIDCMRKGLPLAGEIIGALHHEELKPAATAVTPSPSKRFKLSLPVDQRKRPSRPRSMTALVRQICGQQWAARVTTPLSRLNNDSAVGFRLCTTKFGNYGTFDCIPRT